MTFSIMTKCIVLSVIMLNVTNKPFKLSVIMLSVEAPLPGIIKFYVFLLKANTDNNNNNKIITRIKRRTSRVADS
jgi:hypothetical protein